MKLKLKEITMETENGKKVTISFEKSFSPEDKIKIINKLQGDISPSEDTSSLTPNTNLDFNRDYDSLTIREKLKLVVNQIKHGWFTSEHIRELYQYYYHKEIKPSTVSTYLARMFVENVLERRGSRAKREYRLAESEIAPIEYINEI